MNGFNAIGVLMRRRRKPVKCTKETKPTKETIGGVNLWCWVEGEEECRMATNFPNWKGTISQCAIAYFAELSDDCTDAVICVEDKFHDVIYCVRVYVDCKFRTACLRGAEANS